MENPQKYFILNLCKFIHSVYNWKISKDFVYFFFHSEKVNIPIELELKDLKIFRCDFVFSRLVWKLIVCKKNLLLQLDSWNLSKEYEKQNQNLK